jgi:uncharacterized membrane protein HdeD (DUF308 family)
MDVSLSTMTTLARNWWAFVVRGIVAIAFGLIAWFWPDIALNTLIWVFAIFAFATGILAIVAAVRAIAARERWISLAIEGVVGIGAGIVAVVWPDLTAKTFLYIIAAWAIVSGLLAISSAVRLRREIHGEWMLGLAGVAAIVFGIIAFVHPETGALAVLWLIGLSAIVYGVLWTILGFRLRSWLAQMPISSGISATSSPGTVSGSRSQASGAGQPAAGRSASTSTAQTSGSRSSVTASQAGTSGVTISPATGESTKTDPISSTPAAAAAAMGVTSAHSQMPAESNAKAPIPVNDDHAAAASAGVTGVSQSSSRGSEAVVVSENQPKSSAVTEEAVGESPGTLGEHTASSAETSSGISGDAGELSNSAGSAAARLGIAEAENASDTIATSDESGVVDVDSEKINHEAESLSSSGVEDELETASRVDADMLPPTDSAALTREEDFVVMANTDDVDARDEQVGARAEPMSRRERALADLIASLPPEGTGWVHGNGTLTNPSGYPLKGNASSHIFHAPGGQSYDVTIAEICFATEGDALSAGFRPRHGDPSFTGAAAAATASVVADDNNDESNSAVATGDTERTLDAPAPAAAEVESGATTFDQGAVEANDATTLAETASAATIVPVESLDEVESFRISDSRDAAIEPERSRSERDFDALIAGLPPEGSGWVRGTGVYTTPKGYPVKGNGSSRIYHLPGGQNYQATIPEICFATVDDARAGGFRPRHGDPAEADWSLVEESPSDSSIGIASPNAVGAADEPSREDLELLAIIAELPPKGSGWVLGTGEYTTPPGYPIKGNASSRIFHVPGGQNYQATIPEICFKTVDDARAGGFRPRHGDPETPDWSLVEESQTPAPMGIAAAEGIEQDATIDSTEMSREEQALAQLIATLPPEGSGWVKGTGTYTTPAGYPVKGNASSRIYHLPGGQNYPATIPEVCFASVEDARSGGFRPRHGDPAEADWSLVEETPASEAMGIAQVGAANDAADAPTREEAQLAAIIATLPPEGSGWVKGTGVYTTPSGYPIKGNASSRIYHVPGGQNYQATIPEVCFESIEAAKSGGFRARHGDPVEPDWSLVEVTPGSEPMGIASSGAQNLADLDPEVAEILATLPANGSGWRLGDGSVDCPSSHPIKGNASSKIFHQAGGRSYDATIPEFCFASPEDALEAGFRQSKV